MHIHFLGAAGTVTGSKFLIEHHGQRILVDCGLFQGLKELRDLNWEPFPYDVSVIDTIIITHAHLDHVGYLPRLIRQGYSGPVYSTPPTVDLAEIILMDSAEIQMEEARLANEGGYTSHDPAKPLYDIKDVQRTMPLFQPIPVSEWTTIGKDIRFRFRKAGHIIGAAFVEMEISGKRITFSGDLGREESYLLDPPEKPADCDLLILESTYGDRLHPKDDTKQLLKQLCLDTIGNGGTLLIPSFTVERAQELMYLLYHLDLKNEIPKVPIIMDSPMGTDVSFTFCRYPDWTTIDVDECLKMCRHVRLVESFDETKSLAYDGKPKVVIAGSGMITGGRILEYLKQGLNKPANTVLLVGFQAEGTRGRQLSEGTHELKIHGRYYPVLAQVQQMSTLSAHADQQEMINWISQMDHPPSNICLVHGEPQAADVFRVKLQDEFGIKPHIPSRGEVYGF